MLINILYYYIGFSLFMALGLFQTGWCVTTNNSGLAPWHVMNDGYKIPGFVLGTWLGYANGQYTKSDGMETQLNVERAINIGYRNIDTSPVYGPSILDQIDTAIENKIKDGTITRDDIFVTFKLPKYASREKDLFALLRRVNKRVLKYQNLVLIHWPMAEYKHGHKQIDDSHDYLTTWRSLIKAKEMNLTRSIGVSNFNISQLHRIIANTGHKPAVQQTEVNLNGNNDKMLEYCKHYNITVMGYTTLGSVFSGSTDHNHPPPRATDKRLKHIASTHNKTVAQVVIRYSIDLGVIPIVKTLKAKRLSENINVFDFKLNNKERKFLKTFDLGFKHYPQTRFHKSKYYPYAEYNKNLETLKVKLIRWCNAYFKGTPNKYIITKHDLI